MPAVRMPGEHQIKTIAQIGLHVVWNMDGENGEDIVAALRSGVRNLAQLLRFATLTIVHAKDLHARLVDRQHGGISGKNRDIRLA